MSDVALLVIVFGLPVLALVAVGAYSAKRLGALIEAVRPIQVLADQKLIQRIADVERSLLDTTRAHKAAVEVLPQRLSAAVSAEVHAALDPARKELESRAQESRSLSEALGRSHDHLSQAVLTLNQEGTLGEWVASFREVVEPLRSAGSAIDRHYDTAGQLLRTTSGLVEQWATQRDAVVQAFQGFSTIVARSAAAETTHLRDIEQRLMNRLEEVHNTDIMVSKALSELQTASRNAMETSTDLTRSVEKSRDQFTELIELSRNTQSQHHELIRVQQQVQKDLAESERRSAHQAAAVNETVGASVKAYAGSLESLHKETGQAMRSLASHLEQLQKSSAEAIQKLNQAQSTAAAQQEATAREQSAVVDRIKKLLGDLPTQRGQRFALVLLALQVAATVFVGAAIHLFR